MAPNGILTCQLFGKNDQWSSDPERTFHSLEEVQDLLKDLKIILLEERESDGILSDGTPKHWHIFNIIAQKI